MDDRRRPRLRRDVVQQIIDRGITVCPAVSPHWRMLPALFGEERAAEMFDLVRQMADAGVKLIAGTDAGVQRATFNGLVPALSFYAHLGLANAEIINMATTAAATALGLGSTTGRIAPGYRADLIAVGETRSRISTPSRTSRPYSPPVGDTNRTHQPSNRG